MAEKKVRKKKKSGVKKSRRAKVADVAEENPGGVPFWVKYIVYFVIIAAAVMFVPAQCKKKTAINKRNDANELAMAGKYDEAIAKYDGAVKFVASDKVMERQFKSELASVCLEYAGKLESKAKWTQAAALYEKAIANDADMALSRKVYYSAARTYFMAKDKKNALRMAKLAVEKSGGSDNAAEKLLEQLQKPATETKK